MSNIWIEYIGKFISDYLSNGDTCGKHCYCNTKSRKWTIDWHICISPWTILKVRAMNIWTVDVWNRKRWHIRQTLLLSTNIKLHTSLPLSHLQLIISHSKSQGQGQGHAHSSVNILQTVTDRTNISNANTESRMWPFDWHNYTWRWPIL